MKKKIWILAAVCTMAAGIFYYSENLSARSSNTLQLEEQLIKENLSENDKEKGNVSDLFTIDYDKLYVFGAYQSKEGMEEQLGFSSRMLQESLSEGMLNYIFVKDNTITAYFYGYPSDIGYCINLAVGQYTKEQLDQMKYETKLRKVTDTKGGDKFYCDYNFYLDKEIEPVSSGVVVQSNHEITAIPAGDEVTVELDGQGPVTIQYQVSLEAEEKKVEKLVIDGKDFSGRLEKLGAQMMNPLQTQFYIVDLAESDEYKEIALVDEAFDGDPQTFFFRYKKGTLFYLGAVSDQPESGTFYFQNQGSSQGEIIASFRLSILQTWFAKGYWKLEDNQKLVFQPQTIYYPYEHTGEGKEQQVKLLYELPLYKEMDKESAATIVGPGAITFVATDNKNWVQMEHENGTQGWFYIGNDNIIEGTNLKAQELFENLCITE